MEWKSDQREGGNSLLLSSLLSCCCVCLIKIFLSIPISLTVNVVLSVNCVKVLCRQQEDKQSFRRQLMGIEMRIKTLRDRVREYRQRQSVFTSPAFPSCLACLHLTNTLRCIAASEQFPPAELHYIADDLDINATLSLCCRLLFSRCTQFSLCNGTKRHHWAWKPIDNQWSKVGFHIETNKKGIPWIHPARAPDTGATGLLLALQKPWDDPN